jgi:hypothetical protein
MFFVFKNKIFQTGQSYKVAAEATNYLFLKKGYLK